MKKLVVSFLSIALGLYILGYYYFWNIFEFPEWYLELFFNGESVLEPAGSTQAPTTASKLSGVLFYEDAICLFSFIASLVLSLVCLIAALFNQKLRVEPKFRAISVAISTALVIMITMFLFDNLYSLLH